jgi:hypothetical protein
MAELFGWALMVAGGGLSLSGLWRVRRAQSWRGWAMTYLFAFRRVVVGLCLIAAGVGLMHQIGWLLAVSVCVGIGEFVESSYYIGVLRWGERRGV